MSIAQREAKKVRIKLVKEIVHLVTTACCLNTRFDEVTEFYEKLKATKVKLEELGQKAFEASDDKKVAKVTRAVGVLADRMTATAAEHSDVDGRWASYGPKIRDAYEAFPKKLVHFLTKRGIVVTAHGLTLKK